MSAGMWVDGARRGNVQYKISDADKDSKAGRHSGGGSAFGAGYDDAPSYRFEENATAGEVAFGDKMF